MNEYFALHFYQMKPTMKYYLIKNIYIICIHNVICYVFYILYTYVILYISMFKNIGF